MEEAAVVLIVVRIGKYTTNVVWNQKHFDSERNFDVSLHYIYTLTVSGIKVQSQRHSYLQYIKGLLYKVIANSEGLARTPSFALQCHQILNLLQY